MPSSAEETTPHDRTLKDQLASFVGVGETAPVEPEPALPMADGERVAWTGNLTARWPLAIGAINLIVGAILLFVQWPIGLIVLLSGLPVLAFGRITVLVDARGVRVRFGFLPWPSKFVPIERIEHAASVDLAPTEWGGWGYRIARPAKGFSRSAVVLRGGDALHVVLRNGREFAVTIDDAAGAAAVVNAYAGASAN